MLDTRAGHRTGELLSATFSHGPATAHSALPGPLCTLTQAGRCPCLTALLGDGGVTSCTPQGHCWPTPTLHSPLSPSSCRLLVIHCFVLIPSPHVSGAKTWSVLGPSTLPRLFPFLRGKAQCMSPKYESAEGFTLEPTCEPGHTQAMSFPVPWSSGYTPVHPFRALGRNSELLVVSDDKDTATWQRRSLALHWASGLKAQTETEANHTRYAHAGPQALAGPAGAGSWDARPRLCLQVTRSCVRRP